MARAKATNINAQVEKSKRAMKNAFKGEPWTDMFIPINADHDTEETAGFHYVEACVNGTTYLIQKGVPVNVPVPIYVVIKESGRFNVQ